MGVDPHLDSGKERVDANHESCRRGGAALPNSAPIVYIKFPSVSTTFAPDQEAAVSAMAQHGNPESSITKRIRVLETDGKADVKSYRQHTPRSCNTEVMRHAESISMTP
jgi:hypothetical protein